METTKLSTKGQVIIPQRIRRNNKWAAGVEFYIEERQGGVFLKPISTIPKTEVDQVFGCAGYRGPIKTLEEMDQGIAAEIGGSK